MTAIQEFFSKDQPCGFFLVDKPQGISSFKVVSEVKKQLNLPRKYKVGHSGTLDPMATGLLLVFVGKATKLIPLTNHFSKIYSGEVKFGIKTDTDDITGKITDRAELPNLKDVGDIIKKKFTGQVEQLPPAYSALKVSGKRAYQLMRDGKSVELSTRQVQIHAFDHTVIAEDRLTFLIECSTGTYIRAIARDLGEDLGSCATLGSLRREKIGSYSVDDAINLQNIHFNSMQSWYSLLDAVHVDLDIEHAQMMLNANPKAINMLFEKHPELVAEQKVVYDFSGISLGYIQRNADGWKYEFQAVEAKKLGELCLQ